MVTERFGFDESFAVTGQTYPRKVDAQVVSTPGGHRRQRAQVLQRHPPAGGDEADRGAVRGGAGRLAARWRTSATRCAASARRGWRGSSSAWRPVPLQTAAEQWFERTLDDSSNKRLAIPEPFLAIDGCLQIVVNVARGLVVYPEDDRGRGAWRSCRSWRPRRS